MIKQVGILVQMAFMLAVATVCLGEEQTPAADSAPLAIDDESPEFKEAPPDLEGEEEYHFKWRIGLDHGLQYSLNQKSHLPDWMPMGPPEECRRLDGRLGVKIHVDAAAFDENGQLDPITSDMELRRGRIYTQGNTYLFKPMDSKVEAGFSGSDLFFNQGYLRWNDLRGLKSLQVGQFKAPLSLEMMASSGETTFLERGSPAMAFAPGSQLGFRVGGPVWDERATWAFGGFAGVSEQDIGDASESAAGPVARLTALPVYEGEEGQRKLLHLGMGANYRESRENAFRYQSSPESSIAPMLADTGDIEGRGAAIYNLESAVVLGPLSLQGEFFQCFVDRDADADVGFTCSRPKKVDPIGDKNLYSHYSWSQPGQTRSKSGFRPQNSHLSLRVTMYWLPIRQHPSPTSCPMGFWERGSDLGVQGLGHYAPH